MLENWRNIIYFGAPGTGKSTEIKNVANSLLKINLEDTSKESDRIFRVTFHPEYSYYDFVGQYKPVVGFETVDNLIELNQQLLFSSGNGNNSSKISKKPFVYYDFVPGPFTLSIIKALVNASKKPDKKNVLLIIEEISRGNCSAIFGDLFQILDRNSEGESVYGIHLPIEMRNYIISQLKDWTLEKWNEEYSGGFKLPENLYLYASMNTSDESVFPIDSAFKRRWNMTYIKIDYDNKDLENCYLPKPLDHIQWLCFIKIINRKIVKNLRNEDKQIGQWFINKDDTSDEKIFIYKVLSYLWFHVVDRNHGFIFADTIDSYQDLVTLAFKNGIPSVFKDDILEEFNKENPKKLLEKNGDVL